MTPTLQGRWQTRVLLLVGLGVPITAVFAWLYRNITPFTLLGYMLVLGIGWDAVYYRLQLQRWNHDWPPLFFVLFGAWEGIFLWAILKFCDLAGFHVPGIAGELTFGRFAAHYSTVFFITWVALHSLLPILFPRWRFKGGQFSGWR